MCSPTYSLCSLKYIHIRVKISTGIYETIQLYVDIQQYIDVNKKIDTNVDMNTGIATVTEYIFVAIGISFRARDHSNKLQKVS